MEPFLYHGIRDYNINRLINILKEGYILPKRMLKDEFKIERKNQIDFTGQNWISLSQKSLYDEYYAEDSPSMFDVHVYNHPCVVIDPSIEGLKYPTFLLYDEYNPDYIKSLIDDNSNERYSVYSDELQTNIPIPTSKFLAIGYPKEHYIEEKKENYKKELEDLKDTLLELNLNIPVVDSSYYDFADTKEKIKEYKI